MTTTQPESLDTKDRPKPRAEDAVTEEGADNQETPSAPDAEKGQGQKTEDSDASDPKSGKSSVSPASRKIRRLDRQLKKKDEALRETQAQLAATNERIADLEGRLAKTAEGAAKPKPQLSDFASEEEFGKAYAAWQAEQEKSRDKAKETPAAKAPSMTETEERDRDEFRARGVEALGDDFLAASTNKTLAVSRNMAEYLFSSDQGPEILCWLNANPDKAESIARQGEQSRAASDRLLERIEEKIAKAEDWNIDIDLSPPAKKAKPDAKAEGETKDDPPTKPRRDGQTSAAPAPAGKPDRGTTQVDQDLEDMAMDDYAAKRREQEQRRY